MKNKINLNDFLIAIFFFAISFSKGLGLSSDNKIYMIIYFIGLFFGILKLFKINFLKKELINLSIIFGLGLLDFIIGNESTVLFTVITFLFLKKNDLNVIFKSIFWGRLFGFILMIILPQIGLIEFNTMNFYRSTEGGYITRYSFGYSHPNLMHSTFNIIVIMWIYIFFEKIKLKKIIILEIFNFILYQFTCSRTGFLILTIFLIISYITKRSEFFKQKLIDSLNILFIFCIVISLLLGLGYGKIELINSIDGILTGRIRYMNILITNYLPNLIKSDNYSNILFDNGYYDMFYNGGILVTLWFCMIQLKTNIYIKQNLLYKDALLTATWMIYSLTESYYISSIMNVSLLLFVYVIYIDEKNLNNELKEKKWNL